MCTDLWWCLFAPRWPFAIVRTLKSSNQWPCRLYQIHGETHRYIKHSWRGKGEDLWGWLPYGMCCLLAFFTYNPEVHLITDEKAAFAAISPHLYTLSYIQVQCKRHIGSCISTSWISVMEYVMPWRLLQVKVPLTWDTSRNKFAALSTTFWLEPMTMLICLLSGLIVHCLHQLVSNWNLTSYKPHRVTSRRTNTDITHLICNPSNLQNQSKHKYETKYT